ncbi:MAG: response regulator [candidate division Zixibacteria bacterium]|nr:response regulator [candidate division Zixibacteria bacterium]
MLNILVVQSDSVISSEITAFLNRNKFNCQSIISVNKAIMLLKDDSSFDLIIVDVNLPNIPGTELIKYVKQKKNLSTIPIIATSPSGKSDNVVNYMKLGACETISMPYDEKTFIAKIDKALKSGRKSILIVDDDQDILDILKYTLELEGYKIYTAVTAEDAMHLISENNIRAVVSDILLPGMSGFDFMVFIKKEYVHVPVILITGHSGKITPEKILSHGADGYFQKPFKNTELLRNLERVLIRYNHITEETPQAEN